MADIIAIDLFTCIALREIHYIHMFMCFSRVLYLYGIDFCINEKNIYILLAYIWQPNGSQDRHVDKFMMLLTLNHKSNL